ncbi:MAG: hypothetical protein IJ814_04970 [Paludibacteraceae bacterium]|nr:hypothetical protein [Paludibacteraceae bacterium]
MRKIASILLLLAGLAAQAQEWTSILAFDEVKQIAVTPDKVYAVSNGNMFSIDRIYETLTVYDRKSGLHFSQIEQIGYDEETQSLLIIYQLGRIDIITSAGIKAVTDYFSKDITSDKHVNNITFREGKAYLSTEFGVVIYDIRSNSFDCCYIGENASEISVKDITFSGDSIYAKTSSAVYAAHVKDYIPDYNYWHVTATPPAWDTDKGVNIKDNNGIVWQASGSEGVVRTDLLGQRTKYLPNSPISNYCYRIRLSGENIGIVPGKYEVEFGDRVGFVMTRKDGQWKNYSSAYMKSHIGGNTYDYSDIAFDPADNSHFFVASFGYGLIEFRKNEFYKQHLPSNSAIEGVWDGAGAKYIWVDGLIYDAEGNLWMTNISNNGIKVLMHDSIWVNINNEACKHLTRAQDLLISNRNPNIKIVSCLNTGLGVMDDNGTIADQSDDRAVYLTAFKDARGEYIVVDRIWTIQQTEDGALWIGSNHGLYRIADPTAILDDSYITTAIKVSLPSEGISDVFGDQSIRSIEEDSNHNIWIGTETEGLYCLSADMSQVIHHYTSSNSPILSENVQSLAYSANEKILYIGTGSGLMTYRDSDTEGGIYTDRENEGKDITYGSMKGWTTYFSYNNISGIEESENSIYCIADGAMAIINKSSESIEPQSKLTGLNGSSVVAASYNKQNKKTLLLYQDGLIDIRTDNGEIYNMPDLFLKIRMTPSEFYSTYSYNNNVYICSQLGIICVDMKRNEIAETYALQDNNKDVIARRVCIYGDSIYAATETQVLSASLNENLVDYTHWKKMTLPSTGEIKNFGCTGDGIYLHISSKLHHYSQGKWTPVLSNKTWKTVYSHHNTLIGLTNSGLYEITKSTGDLLTNSYSPNDILRSGNDYWIALPEEGMIRWNSQTGVQKFEISSPYENLAYRIRITGNKLIMLPGGYFAGFYNRYGNIMMMEESTNQKTWTNYTYRQIRQHIGRIAYELCDAAMDPDDLSHFYIASFGYGLFEFRNNEFYKHYMPSNTINGLESVLENENGYTWVDGLALDEDGNVWMLNTSQSGVKVLLKNGKWVRISNAATKDLNRSKDLLIWNQNPNIKITTCAREGAGVGVFDDKGTIENTGDDKAIFFSSFVDQNKRKVTPDYIYSICQMADGSIWVGTEKGIIVLPDIRTMLNGSNSCRRIIIPRNDGTGLGDYLLGDEAIYAIAEDAAGRKWIGTANSGLYLVSEDGLETIEHFTENDSPLASNAIYALAINPKTGEVYIGTSIGLMSYQSDANKAHEDFDDIYAYPNPVSSHYSGYISISGLMDNTVVNIIDAGGNLVCKTRSNGGTAIWDGRNAYGQRVTPGIYTALCNAATKHSVCKILIINGAR